ncbi:MAG: Eco57I restriction-modification methylase domain-containing protein [Firmicutes bacterium]|nr:Eco57I restriction-modification methylase domain-containing protein [Bacillota bacterium]
MPDKVWKDIDRIVKSLGEIPSNREIFEKYPETAENLFLSAVFHSSLEIPHEITGRIEELKNRVGEKLPGIIHDYFLDTVDNEKPSESHRRKKGIYYTPDCVAQFIAERTLGKTLAQSASQLSHFAETRNTTAFITEWEKTSSLKILDPACGWGIFLLCASSLFENFYKQASAAARILLESETNITAGKTTLRKISAGNSAIDKLNRIVKICENPTKQVLNYNIYGFDIDSTAAGIAGNLLRRSGSIFCHYEHNITTLDFISDFETIETKFDFILGNPPYFTIGGGGKGKSRTDYHNLLKNHNVFSGWFRSQSDIFYYFIIGSLKLLNPGGTLSFITPSYWMENEHADELRKYLSEECSIREIVRFEPIKVFKSRHGGAPGVDAAILTVDMISSKAVKPDHFFANGQMELDFDLENEQPSVITPPAKQYFNVISPDPELAGNGTSAYLERITSQNPGKDRVLPVNQKKLTSGRWSFEGADPVFGRLKKDGVRIFPLGDISPAELEKYHSEFLEGRGYSSAGICTIGQGQETGMSEVFLVSAEKAARLELETSVLKPNIKNSHIRKYYLADAGQYIIFLTDEDDIEQYPRIRAYLEPFRSLLETRQRVQKGVRKWYAVSIPQNIGVFDQPEKIVVPYRATGHRFAVDNGRHFNDGGDVRGIVINKKFASKISHRALACILNSSLIASWYRKYGKKKGNIYEFFTLPMSRIPVILPDQQQKIELEQLYNEISSLNNLSFNNSPGKRNTEPDGEIEETDRKIRELESRIDSIVYDLYGIQKKPE